VTIVNRATLIGVAVGATIAFIWAWLGFGAIILIAVLGTLGGLVGHLVAESSSSDAFWRSGGRR